MELQYFSKSQRSLQIQKPKVIMEKQSYKRDGRAPIPENKSTSFVMSSIKDKNTKPELLLRKVLWGSGIRGYRLHWKKIPGRPDIAFPSKKLAVFVNGCFWHRCPYCNPPSPKTHTQFWESKFEANILRDQNKLKSLKELGWESIIVWECKLYKNPQHYIDNIRNILFEN